MSVIDRLYVAAAQPEQWVPALDAMTELLDAGHTILAASAGSTPSFMLGAGVAESDLARLRWAHGRGLLAPLDISRRPAGSIIMRNTIVPDDEFLRSDYYNEIIRPLRGFNSAFVRQESAQSAFRLTVCRPQGVDDFRPTEIETLGVVLPHLTNAVELHHRLRAAEHETASLARLLHRVDAGVILVDAAARPLFANQRAERIIGERDGLALEIGGLAACTAAATRRLRDAIRILAAPHNGADAAQLMPDPQTQESVRIRIDRPSMRAPLLLTLLPIWRLDVELSGTAAPRVAIFVNEPDAAIKIDRISVAEAFQLTGRETDIATMLGEGQDLSRIAKNLTLSVATVRNHLKRVFDKTGVHSQAALVARIRGLAEPQR